MKFEKINEGTVCSDDGVFLQIKHPDYLEYRIGDCLATVALDYDPTTRTISVYASRVMEWTTLNGTEKMPDSIKNKFFEDLAKGLSYLKGNFVIK